MKPENTKKTWVSQKLGKLFLLLTEEEREKIIQKLLLKYGK